MQKIEWYDVKTKFKQLLRKLVYSALIQYSISLIFYFYINFVYFTSKKKKYGYENLINEINAKNPVIIIFWHNRLMMTSFIARKCAKKIYSSHKFYTLSSKHGDGRFVGIIMNFFGFKNILGSSKNNRKASRGIDISSLKEILECLKNKQTFVITPDGPRGPAQKINSTIINIAKKTDAKIIILSYNCSRFLTLNSWDKFKIPLPFSRLYFNVEKPIDIRDFDGIEEEKIKEILEKKMDETQEKN